MATFEITTMYQGVKFIHVDCYWGPAINRTIAQELESWVKEMLERSKAVQNMDDETIDDIYDWSEAAPKRRSGRSGRSGRSNWQALSDKRKSSKRKSEELETSTTSAELMTLAAM
jgi:hypothetical protein